MQREEPTARPRQPWWRLVVVGLVAVAAAGHLLVVTLAALPPNTYSDAARPATSYLGAYFAQNWRLFAPNPVSSDRVVRFQGAYEQDGELVVTDWLDWTDVELDLVRHRLVGGRAGYVTTKLYGPLGSRYRPLDADQRAIADIAEPVEVLGWPTLRRELVAVSDDQLDDRQVDLYLVYDRAAARLATEALEAQHPDRRMVAVRYATRSQGVTPWGSRGEDAEARERARPTPVQRINGWREPLRGTAAERASVRDFWERHR
ncbi:DUF5819 family protein [Aeromicrobium sp. 50.2.37]|uniref:DUF5819 family protein n=1 Tax=Aeromicrobium sp. 50.2.37 TaxID=2969305 RepID=UPI00214F99F6|nr:DUF5819 family protein [Aeromicrobium sp. 50.2.37]MCR4513154.1 DUF5819 family protein [Aeromicrobium sp. 50.2.37]